MKTIADYLKNAPKGTKLYSSICGDCTLYYINENEIAVTNGEHYFYFNHLGQYHVYEESVGECLLFPSKKVREWSNYQVPHPEFKKGDILYNERGNSIVIFDHELDKSAFKGEHYYQFTSADYTPEIECFYSTNYKLASESDIERYKRALEASGKGVLNPNTGELYPIFKPFDKVVVRNEGIWHIDFFEMYMPGKESPYRCIACTWRHCLPYNEETAKLIGTNNSFK